MTSYLYIPFKKEEFTLTGRSHLNQVIHRETKEKKREIIYHGQRGLTKSELLAEATVIHVLIPGRAGHMSTIAGAKDLSLETVRHHPSFAGHITLSDSKNSIMIPDLVDQLDANGLLKRNSDAKLHIKLVFTDETEQAEYLTKVFFKFLERNADHLDTDIKVSYSTPKKQRSLYRAGQSTVQTPEQTKITAIKQSFFTHPGDNGHQLTRDQVRDIERQYYDYKSSRCHGLSGLLGLNRLFSSSDSLDTLTLLNDRTISDDKRYQYALQFLRRHPDNHLAKYLCPTVEQAYKDNKELWRPIPEEEEERLVL
ncbi:hypothetical protein [Legionella spiritensis]|uniref:Uncharacterized protein n=1 Tax=Legionella spiritensis TaxID=452 RepID=A0A0W0YYL3_LEGSP|nr:hypothetical protein [Legionella spiritensis]KTD61959.1 hypothetical protein Lspi_2589 [Legionella spiritensis]SNV30906.1 Uncharacterised protein [Legionella spiritensis]